MAEHDEVVDPDDPLDFLLADTDMTFSDCLAPHFGQAIFFSSDVIILVYYKYLIK